MDLTFYYKRKDFISTFCLALAYAAVFYGIQLYFFKSSMVTYCPSEARLFAWDVGWYQSVAQHGYQYQADGPSNIAFFILFPMIWKISHLGLLGISVLNIVFFAAGFSVLCSFFKLSVQNKLLWLTIPTIYFAFIPYSEALFFFLSSVTLYGLKKNNFRLVWVSLFMLSLTRATGAFLAPAFLAMCLFSAPMNQWYKSLFIYLKNYLSPILAGTAFFIWYQYKSTGIWFVFFQVEEKFWGHKFRWLSLPFKSGAGPYTTWISALAVFVCLVAFIFLLVQFFKWLFNKNLKDSLLILSCGYLFMSLLEIIFFSPAWEPDTMVIGISRYTFMNPFFYVFLYYFSNSLQYNWKNYLGVFFLANIVWLSFGSYNHIQSFLYFMGNTFIIFLFMMHSNKKLEWPVLVLVALNFYFQVQLFQTFIGFSIYPD